jgi:hypothetical protein
LLKAADKLADPQTDLPAASSLSQESCIAASLSFLALKVSKNQKFQKYIQKFKSVILRYLGYQDPAITDGHPAAVWLMPKHRVVSRGKP